MKFYQIDNLVRTYLKDYRLYNWKQIEEWREALSKASYSTVGDTDENLNNLVEAINSYRLELRQNKQFDVSDRLRDILESTGNIAKDSAI